MRARIFSLNFEIIFSQTASETDGAEVLRYPTIWVMTTSAFRSAPVSSIISATASRYSSDWRTGGQRRGKHGAHDKAKDFFHRYGV